MGYEVVIPSAAENAKDCKKIGLMGIIRSRCKRRNLMP